MPSSTYDRLCSTTPHGFFPFVETYTSAKLPWATTGATHSFPEFPPMEAYEALTKEFLARA